MKKLISVCMALVLALGLTGICLAESENAQAAPSPDPYSGIWQCNRRDRLGRRGVPRPDSLGQQRLGNDRMGVQLRLPRG